MEHKQIALANLASSTQQEVFDWGVANLLKQGKRSEGFDAGGELVCLYRGDDGRKCFGGWMISDEEYTAEMEGSDWAVQATNGIFPATHKELITRGQNIHDAEDPENWPGEFHALADEYGLEWNLAFAQEEVERLVEVIGSPTLNTFLTFVAADIRKEIQAWAQIVGIHWPRLVDRVRGEFEQAVLQAHAGQFDWQYRSSAELRSAFAGRSLRDIVANGL